MPRKAMQQRASPDKGTPGHIYFPEPVLTEITNPNKVSYMTPGVRRTTNPEGMCRLASSFECNNYTPPTDCKYMLNEFPTYMQIVGYLRDQKIHGFDEGAVVTRKYQNPRRWMYPSQWGIILLKHESHLNSAKKFYPYTVKWFHGDKLESAWAEDLIIIHSCIDEDLLRDIVEAQGVPVNDL
jgi:hypothetical protein